MQTLAPNESLPRANSGSKWIITAQTRVPKESLLCRLWLQINHWCADSGSKWITTVQTLAPNESLLCRLWLQMNHYCANSGSKRVITVQILAPNKSLLRRLTPVSHCKRERRVSGAEAVRMQSRSSTRSLPFHTGSVCSARLNSVFCTEWANSNLILNRIGLDLLLE